MDYTQLPSLDEAEERLAELRQQLDTVVPQLQAEFQWLSGLVAGMRANNGHKEDAPTLVKPKK
jgi:hypothetical protein